MFDLRIIREQPDRVRDSLKRRGGDGAMVDAILNADTTRRAALTELETLRAQRNTASKEIGRMKDETEREARKAQVREINTHIETLDKTVAEVDTRLNDLVSQIPNIPDDDVPFGKDDSENVILRTVGTAREFDFAPLAHWDIGTALGILDFERGVKISGSRFYVLQGAGAKLQRALIQWLLDLHVQQGYYEIYPPFMVKENVVYGSGQLPKFRDNLFHDVEKDAWFVPTAEVPLTGLHQDEIIDAANLPLHYVAYTPCFRKEPMSAGKDVRGIKRGFQFDKVEMYKFCLPENSAGELETLRQNAEDSCAALGIPYRVKLLCTGDIGFAARKTYDIEMWAPGQNEWLEVSSCSNVGDFQARRANIRFRREAGAKTEFAHTLNGSGFGIPRTMIAIIENYQQKDGSIVVPDVLRPYVKIDVIK
jgi:seryl-tRNA synthetase